jgi:hypothetical protein
MRKIFMLLLVCVAISLLNTGCVDVAGGPGGGGQVNPDTPTNPNDPNNPGDPTNPDNPTNPSDPDIGEPGVNYITNWDDYDTTTSPQKYIGATYNDANTATVPTTIGAGAETAPYKTTFSDGTVSYSIGKYKYVIYTENETALDCRFEGTAPDGFVTSDYTFSTDTNAVEFSEAGTSYDSTSSTDGVYTTVFYYSDTRYVAYKTSQPILKVTYQKSNTGENYFGKTSAGWVLSGSASGIPDSSVPYATLWDDGTFTLSIHEFADISYAGATNTKAYTTDGEDRKWKIGTAPAGNKESDYEYSTELDHYKYVGSSAAGGETPATPAPDNSDDEGLSSDDVADIINDIIDNDGRDLLAP